MIPTSTTRLDYAALQRRWSTESFTPSLRTVRRRAKFIGHIRLGRQVFFPEAAVAAYEHQHERRAA